MSVKRAVVLGAGLLLLWFIGIADLRLRPQTGIRFLNDNYDRQIYYQRGSWIVHQAVPYRDIASEYPQVPTYLFALPYLGLSWVEPMSQLGYWGWSSVFSFAMLASLFVTILLLHGALPEHKNLSLLLLLPAFLYFTYNRFDILPALICLVSFLFLSREKFIWAAVLLGVGTLTKWYPALLLPVFLAYAWWLRRKIPWGMILAFGITCLILILPTLLEGGFDALLAPYQFHLSREWKSMTLLGMLGQWIGTEPEILTGLFLVLQFLAAPLCLFYKMDSLRKVLLGSNLVLACFFLFARIYSPQWILWLVPFLVLSVENGWDVVWIIAGGLVTYLAFPVIFDLAGEFDARMVLMGITQIIFLVRVILTSIRRMRTAAADPVTPSDPRRIRSPLRKTA